MVPQSENLRRIDAVVESMKLEGLDALVLCGREEGGGRGYIQYITSITDTSLLSGRPFAVLSSRGEVTFCPDRELSESDNRELSFDVRLGGPAVQRVASKLEELGCASGTVGVAGLGGLLTRYDYQSISEQLPNLKLKDASEWFDRTKSHHSEFEVDRLQETCDIIRKSIDSAAARLVPGMNECELAAEVWATLQTHGAVEGFVHIARSGGEKPFHPPLLDEILIDDMIGVDVQVCGPSGYMAEVTRYFSFVEPSARLADAFNATNAAFYVAVDSLRTGVTIEEFQNVLREAYEKSGYTNAGPVGWGPVGLQLHGIGLDGGEPPFIPGSAEPFFEGMVVALHPRLGPESADLIELTPQDNVVIEGGRGRVMAYDSRDWVVLPLPSLM